MRCHLYLMLTKSKGIAQTCTGRAASPQSTSPGSTANPGEFWLTDWQFRTRSDLFAARRDWFHINAIMTWGSKSPWVTNCLWCSVVDGLQIRCATNKKLHNSRIPSTSDDNTHARWWSETGQILGLRFAPCLLFRYWLCWWVCVLN